MPSRVDGTPSIGGTTNAVWAIGLTAVLALVAAYVSLTFAQTPLSATLAQVVFCLPVTAAAVAAVISALRSPTRTRERTFWWIVAFSMTFLALGEISYSVYQILVDIRGPQSGFISDVFFLVGGVGAFVLLVHLAGFDLLSPPTRIRLISESMVLLSLAAALSYAAWELLFPHTLSADAGVRLVASYNVVQGFVALAVGIALWAAERSSGGPRWARAASVGFVIYSAGLFLWPAWHEASTTRAFSAADVGVESLFLVGYGLVALAGVGRIVSSRHWDPIALHAPHDGRYGAISVAVSAFALGAMTLIVVLAFSEPFGAPGSTVYATVLVIAGIGTLVSSSATTYEGRSEGNRALRDPVTGLGNSRMLDDTLGRSWAVARANGLPLSVIHINVDDFGRLNRAQGFVASDESLRTIGQTIADVMPTRVTVSRQSGDRFCAIGLDLAHEDALDVARDVRRALAGIEFAGARTTASIGVATMPQDGDDPDTLLHAAEAASSWAKYHGKDRIVSAGPAVTAGIEPEDVDIAAETGMRLDLARGLAAAIDARDFGNPYHGRNVGTLARIVAEQLGYDALRVSRLETAGLLHDVGTLALPDTVMESPGRAAAIRRHEHCALGERFCRSIGFEDIAPWIRHHHEHWDGTGYPDGLSAEAIPEESRLLALCDAYDKLTSGRRGRSKLSRAAALQDIDQGIASRFEPELTERFIAIVGRYDALGWDEAAATS